MERRKHPRIRIPLEVNLSHPFIGQRTATARDLNDEGVYIWYPDPPFKVGSAISVTVRCNSLIESRPTPTVRMRVTRVEDDGLVLGFVNKSSTHLWRSATHTPEELAVGKDLLRVYQAAVVVDDRERVLTVQQNGRWLFPGCFLESGHHWQASVEEHLNAQLGLTETTFLRTVLTHNDPSPVARESSTMSVFHLYSAATTSDQNRSSQRLPVQLCSSSPYSKARWVETLRTLDELTFSAPELRELARSVLTQGTSAERSASVYATPQPDVEQEVVQKHG